jgi:hypothetical protein
MNDQLHKFDYSSSDNSFPLYFGACFFLLIMLDTTISAFTSFILKSILLTIYLLVEIIRLKKAYPENWLMSPVVLASIFTFLLGFGITNFIYFLPDSQTSDALHKYLGSNPFPVLANTMDSIILASFAMWLGYRSSFGKKLYNLLTSSIFNINRYFKFSYELNYPLIYTLILISIAARLYAINLGIFGYTGTSEQLSESAKIAFALYLFGSLGKFSLLTVSLSYYEHKTKKLKIIFITLIIFELLFGLISGFKTDVIIPFLIPLTAFYIIKKKINKSFLTAALIFLLVAYAVIEPFRVLRHLDRQFSSNPVYMVNMMIEAYNLNKKYSLTNQLDTDFFLISIASRNNYLLVAARAIEYNDEVGLQPDDPDFLMKLVTIPASAFIPRAVWSNKPVEDIARWFSVYVWGAPSTSSTAMTPIGFLYFAGGNFFVFIFFIVFGIMQRTLFQFYNKGSGGKIIYFGLVMSLIFIDSAVNGIFVDWIRSYPMLVILQYFTFRK